MDVQDWRQFRDSLAGLPPYALADKLVEFKKSGKMSYRDMEREFSIPKETVVGWVSAGRVPPPWVSMLLLYALRSYEEQGQCSRVLAGRPRSIRRLNDDL